jgi:hypothetical protein
VHALDVHDLPVRGVLEVVQHREGVRYSRLPAWARAQVGSGYLDLMASMPAGARIAFRTDSAWLELDVALTTLRYGRERPAPALDLVVDGELVATTRVTDVTTLRPVAAGQLERVPGGPATVRVDLTGARGRVVEVWLPHDATVEIRRARVEQGTSLEPVETGRRWIHYGSSISQSLEAERPTDTWPARVARRSGLDLLCLGFGGQCALDQQVARVIRDEPADLISLKVGINAVGDDLMRERAFRPALHAFLDTVRDGHPTTPAVVITPVHCPSAETQPGPLTYDEQGRFGVLARPPELAGGALTLELVRAVTQDVVSSRGDDRLHLVDGLNLLGPADADRLYDGLHPDAEGYRLIAERFDVAGLLG